jgi:hypothetical protein
VRWRGAWASSGRAGLQQAGRAGRKPRLRGAQLQQIEDARKRGPEAQSYASGLGSAGRMREVIEDLKNDQGPAYYLFDEKLGSSQRYQQACEERPFAFWCLRAR